MILNSASCQVVHTKNYIYDKRIQANNRIIHFSRSQKTIKGLRETVCKIVINIDRPHNSTKGGHVYQKVFSTHCCRQLLAPEFLTFGDLWKYHTILLIGTKNVCMKNKFDKNVTNKHKSKSFFLILRSSSRFCLYLLFSK